MKSLRLFFIILVLMNIFYSSAFATEIGEAYKHWGTFNYVTAAGLRVYYPDKIKEAIPRILTSFSKVRERVIANFPKDKDYVATVILDDHDNMLDSTADTKFDLINLCIFDEMDVLSARSYSLEKRFALSLAKTLVKRATSNVSFTWRRSLALLSVPHWFIEGMALNYAFTMDSLHYSRLLDMARYNRLYSLNDLNTITSQPTLVKEEMLFQAHSMLAYWENTYKKGADVEVVSSLIRSFKGFENAFKKYYGVSLNEAYKSYKDYINSQTPDFESYSDPDFLDVDYIKNDAKIFRSYLRISERERLWVSSKRYTTENYDLYYRNGIEKPRILLKNVHPSMFYDADNREVIIGKYTVNGHRDKVLNLYAVDLNGKSRCIVPLRGSFKPLGKKGKRIYFVNVHGGITRIMSTESDKGFNLIELDLGASVRPLDLALDLEKNRLFYTFQTIDFETHLAVIKLNADNPKIDSKILLSCSGDLRGLKCHESRLWGAFDQDNSTTQLFCFDEKENRLKRYSNIPGGVWDISFSDPDKKKVEVTTLYKGGFAVASLPLENTPSEVLRVVPGISAADEKFIDFETNRYKTEYHDSLWKPVLGKDSEGKVLGIYSYRSDRLDRSGIVVAPTYGLKSNDWGYTSVFMKRFDILKASVSFDDYTVLKGYMDTDYFERNRSKRLQFDYPLKIDMNLSFGFNLVQRGIAKIEKTETYRIPTAGKDHYYFVELSQKSIRTEPYNNIFPRKGRTVDLSYKRGVGNLFGGDMLYDSISLKWNEYFPLNDYYVLAFKGYVAGDDKHNNIRRPDDLSLGSDEYLRAFDSSYKSGDELRYASFALARPINITLPRQIGWLRTEFSTLGVFWEMGDTRNNWKFDYDYDRGVEFASSLLLFKRLPISIKAGYAVRNGQEGHGTYCNIYTDDISEIINN